MENPNIGYLLDRKRNILHSESGMILHPESRTWKPGTTGEGGKDHRLDPVSPTEAVAWLQTLSGYPLRTPVGVIGPREPDPEQLQTAELLGRRLGEMGVFMLCGGRGGVMEACCRGTSAAGGISIGLLPDEEPQEANRHASIVLASGIGPARNAILARAALCLVAVGGGVGTLSEMALGIQFNRPVISLCNAPHVPGAIQAASLDDALQQVAAIALNFFSPA
ncbi:MAG: TIGR00725 family protein [Deltaproteobacteria bacterium]|nr:TIGR00725 family protein [Deltaproteobacteria bacterium]